MSSRGAQPSRLAPARTSGAAARPALRPIARSGGFAQATTGSRFGTLLAAAFLATSLLVPRLFDTPYQLEDFLLVGLAAFYLFQAPLSRHARELVVATTVCATSLGLVGLIALNVAHPPPFFHTTHASILKEFGRLAKQVILAFAFAHLADRHNLATWNTLRKVLFILLTVHVLIGIAQYFQVPAVTSFIAQHFLDNSDQIAGVTTSAIEQGNFRATGTVYNPNIYGYLGVFLGASLTYLYRGKPRAQFLSALLLLAAVVLSQSRTAFVGALVALYWMSPATRARTRNPGVRVAILLLVVAALAIGSQTNVVSRFTGAILGGAGEFATNRPQYAELPHWVLGYSPMFGFGIGTFWILPPDSDVLFALMETGIIGVCTIWGYYAYLGVRSHVTGGRAWLFSFLAIVGGLTNGVFFGNEIYPFAMLFLVLLWFGERDQTQSS